jgi:hypothetical protein
VKRGAGDVVEAQPPGRVRLGVRGDRRADAHRREDVREHVHGPTISLFVGETLRQWIKRFSHHPSHFGRLTWLA